MKPGTDVWNQNYGSSIRICDMTDTHLNNTIETLEHLTRAHDHAFALASNPFLGDIASDMMDDAQEAILEGEYETDPSELYPMYKELTAERDARQKRAAVPGISLLDIVTDIEKTMQCNCDLDAWEPERSTGHSWVCRIHKAAIERNARQKH